MFRRVQAGIMVCVLMLLSLQGASGAQTATPAASEPVDVPTTCSVQPVSFLSLLAMLNDMSNASAMPPLSSVSLDAITPGTPVDAQDLEAIDATNRELVGCANSFQVMSVLALLSEDFQARLAMAVLDGNEMDAILEQLPMLASDTAESEGIQAIPVQSAWYPEGNDRAIMAILEPVTTDPANRRSFLVTYVFSIDHWVIHDVQLITGDGAA